jgi:signal transduction histidine kinase
VIPEEPERAQINMRILRSPLLYVADRLGPETAQALLIRAGIDPDRSDDTGYWVSVAAFAAFLDGVFEAVGRDDEAFKAACAYRLNDAYGSLRHVIAATSPAMVIGVAMRTMSIVARTHRGEVVGQTRNSTHVRFRSTVPEHETRLVCLSRIAQGTELPTLFGLPRGTATTLKCMARGDDCCEEEYHFYTKSRIFPTALAFVVGLIIAAFFAETIALSPLLCLALPLICALVASRWEIQDTYRHNLAHGERIQQALRDVAEQEAVAREELLALHQRQRSWTRLMEEQMAERTHAQESLLARLRNLSEERASSVRGFSHDLRNPLSVVIGNLDYLSSHLPDDPDCRDALDDSRHALASMERLLLELVAAARSDEALVRVTPATLAVAPLAERVRRRLKALVFGRDIAVSVAMHDAPARIETDELILERVLDNLCTNAAKYTHRGNIAVTLGGGPDTLTIEVADTGVGIADKQIPHIFRPRLATAGGGPKSLGLGLSVVVRLMAQVGGRIEVASREGNGSTFRAHFPVALPAPETGTDPASVRRAVEEVVTIHEECA